MKKKKRNSFSIRGLIRLLGWAILSVFGIFLNLIFYFDTIVLVRLGALTKYCWLRFIKRQKVTWSAIDNNKNSVSNRISGFLVLYVIVMSIAILLKFA